MGVAKEPLQEGHVLDDLVEAEIRGGLPVVVSRRGPSISDGRQGGRREPSGLMDGSEQLGQGLDPGAGGRPLDDAHQIVLGQVDDVVLRAPVLLIPERHTDGKGFFSAPQFGDDSAMRLLVDMIVENPEKRDVLGRLLRRLGV